VCNDKAVNGSESQTDTEDVCACYGPIEAHRYSREEFPVVVSSEVKCIHTYMCTYAFAFCAASRASALSRLRTTSCAFTPIIPPPHFLGGAAYEILTLLITDSNLA